MMTYKVVELSIVTNESIEEALNKWTAQGWVFDGLHFVVGAGSKRPSMAFVFFVRSLETSDAGEGKGEL